MTLESGPEIETPDGDAVNEGDASLDLIVPDSWDENHIKLLDAWRQGDLLRGGSFSWIAPPGLDPITGVDSSIDDTSSDWNHVLAEQLRFKWVVITSQTCDIAGAGPGRRHPFIQASPVVNVDGLSQDTLINIRTRQIPHLFLLTAPSEEGTWCVDLRVSFPVSKYLLLRDTPIHGFSREMDALEFSEHVAGRIRRPSLHDALSTDLPKSIGAHIKSVNKNNPEWWENVEQLRLQVTGERLRPTSVRLIVIQETTLSPDERKIWQNWRKPFARTLKREHGISMERVHFTNIRDMRALMYASSIALRVPELERPYTW